MIKPLLYFLYIVCSSGQSALGKRYASHGGSPDVFNIDKALAGIIIFTVAGLFGGISFHIPTIVLGLFYGASLCISMRTGFKALEKGPMALTSVIASFSLVIPFVFGIFVWDEALSPCGAVGILLLASSILLLNLKKESGLTVGWSVCALLTLFTNGICSVIQKYHQLLYSGLYRTEFLISALLCVLVFTFIIYLADKNRQPFTFCADGIVAGIMNGGANYIVLCLAATEKATVLFPVLSVANIIAVWIIGRFAFSEKIKKIQLVGFFIGILSVVLLNIS